jgi:hypothetical protein
VSKPPTRTAFFVGISFALFAGAGIGVWRVAGYKDPATAWTAIAGILAGVAMLAALIGVPFAVLGFLQTRDELRRLNAVALKREEIDQAAEKGLELQLAWKANPTAAGYRAWRTETASVLERVAGRLSRLDFEASAKTGGDIDMLMRQIDYLRNYLKF